MSKDIVQSLDENIRQAKEIVEVDSALQRLESNRDFRKVIKEGYLEKEAIRLVHLKADPAFQTVERQASIDTQINAIGQLAQYFRTVTFNASVAARAIEADEYTRTEVLAEENGNG
jgi:hypothetical protein